MKKIYSLQSLVFFVVLQLISNNNINAQCRLLNENFNVNPVLASSNTDGAWYPDRYRPAGFVSFLFGAENVLKISIDGVADGAASRPSGYSSTFYNTQGRKFNQCGKCVTQASGKLYIPADWATSHRRSDMWATANDGSDLISAYPIIGFRNPDGSSPGIYYWDDNDGWILSSVVITYNSWYKLGFKINGGNIEYFVNDVSVGSVPGLGSTYLSDIMLQAYNFNDPALSAIYQSADSYDAYWDNVVSSNSAGTSVTNVNTGQTFCSIQSAINDPNTANGHTLQIGPGTFRENVIVNKELTLNGSGQAATFVYPAISSPNSCGGSLCPTASNVFLVKAHNVTIQNLTIDGDNPALTSGVVVNGADVDARNGIITDHTSGTFNNLNVNHTTVKNIYLRGIYVSSGGTFNITNNIVSNVSGEYSSIGIFNWVGAGNISNNTVTGCNDAIASNHSSGTNFSGNTVTNSGTGVHSDNNGDGGGLPDVIENNTVSNSPVNGYGIFVFAPYKNVVVRNNSIANVEVGLTSAGSYTNAVPIFERNTVDGQMKANSIGVYSTTEIWGYPSGNQNAIFRNNFIRNNVKGFLMASEAGYTNASIVNENSITGNTVWVKLANDYTEIPPTGAYAMNFNCNWWGTLNSAEIGANVPTAVDYTPYLTNGTDNAPGTPGFQPVPNSCNGFQYVDCGNKKEKKVVVCHNGKSTCIALSALSAHLAHGDILGPCNTNRGEDFITDLSEEFSLTAAPNPAVSTTVIRYELPVDCQVSITLFDPMGRIVAVLVQGSKTAGAYNYELNTSKLSAGIYYYKMTAVSKDEKYTQGQKLVIMK